MIPSMPTYGTIVWHMIEKRGSYDFEKVGMTGIEPATSRPPAVRANRTAPHPEFDVNAMKDTFLVFSSK